MKRTLSFITLAAVWVLFTAAGSAGDRRGPENLPLPGTRGVTGSVFWPFPKERGTYQAKRADTGERLWAVRWETTVVPQKEGVLVEILEEGSGTPWRQPEPIRWQKRMVLLSERTREVDPPLLFQSLTGTRWDRQGKVLSELEIRADSAKREVFYRDVDQQKQVSRTLGWTAQMLPDELLFHWARSLPFDRLIRREPVGFTLLLSPTRQFQIQALFRSKEKITTPAGSFSCYRINLVPRLLGPLKKLAPEISLWCTDLPPYHWVRYQGPAGGPGSPQAIIELVKFEQSEN
ncbi:MAG: DUF3108 domain-containing protein [Candidatus Omnitrophica bacterium]|nr:DUF3108 domain-containing protein [Candidatus Omnitrophota bacterium]